MPEPVMKDKDVIALVRKELERKIADYCKKHGIDPEEGTDEDIENGEEEDTNPMGKRTPPTGEKPENLNVDAFRKSIGLRVTHKDSGLEYYVRGVNTGTGIIDLETPEKTLFQVDFGEIENDYKLG